MNRKYSHIPVLKNEIFGCFSYLKQTGGIFVDGTVGLAGHSLLIEQRLAKSTQKSKIVAIDKDKTALRLSEEKFKKTDNNIDHLFIHDDFKNISQILEKLKISKIDGALLDLGVSSVQLDDKTRGFSFEDRTAKLDMRMDSSQKLNAKEIINNYSESKLINIFFDFGEERFSKQIAKNICQRRKKSPITTVGELNDIIGTSIPNFIKHKSQKHLSTNIFRALRIEVNNELEKLEEAISEFVDFLNPGGRLAVISFNSTEDRIVKNIFKKLSLTCSCPDNSPICNCNKKAKAKIINKKPIIPNNDEIRINPRSRSSKLRIVEKLN